MQNVMSQTFAKSMLDSPVDANMSISTTNTNSDRSTMSCWGYWTDYYYPSVIRESYPVYISERAKDKGKQAFEILKILKDKKLVKMDKVADFVDLMDELIKIL
jgi:hypothetical protein